MGPEPEDGPEERLRRERRELGVDHALVGAVLVRRWGLPASIAAAVERHHSPEADGHRRRGPARRPDRPSRRGRPRLADVASQRRARVGLDEDGLRDLLFEYPHAGERPAAHPSRARSRRARSTRSAAWPRARSTSRSPRSSPSRSRRSAPTSTTSTRRSARSTAPRPSSSRASAAGSSRSAPSVVSRVAAYAVKCPTRSGRCAGRSRPRGRGRGRPGGRASPSCGCGRSRRSGEGGGRPPSVELPSARSWRVWRWRWVSALEPELPVGGGIDEAARVGCGLDRGPDRLGRTSSWPRRRRRRPRSLRSRRAARRAGPERRCRCSASRGGAP